MAAGRDDRIQTSVFFAPCRESLLLRPDRRDRQMSQANLKYPVLAKRGKKITQCPHTFHRAHNQD